MCHCLHLCMQFPSHCKTLAEIKWEIAPESDTVKCWEVVLPEKSGGVDWGPLPKTVTPFIAKICNSFCYPIYDLAKNSILYLCSLWLAQLSWTWLWRAFAHGLIDNDEKVASSKKYTQFKTRVLKPYLRPKWLQLIPYLWPKWWKTIPFGAGHNYFYHNCRNWRALIGQFLLSICGQTHEFKNHATYQRARAINWTICYHK